MPRKRQSQVKTEDETAIAAGQTINPSSMNLSALKEELGKRGLKTSGKKAELVERLQEALSDTPTASKKVKEEPEQDTDAGKSSFSKAAATLRKADKKKRTPKVDSHVAGASMYTVVDDWDCMLNQTNIGHNNNKFYVIQLLQQGLSFSVWNRWGRVGEPGQSAMKPFGASFDKASKEFCKKYKDKTRNDWENRDNFEPVPGKYTLIDMGDEDDGGAEEMIVEETDAPPVKVKACTLDKPTQELIKLIFDNDMFQSAMKKMDLDTKKMPLGKLSKVQIAKGFEALEELEGALNAHASRSKLMELSSKFYTIIPHSFGRQVPPIIDNPELLQKKFDMLTVLGDIEIAQSLQKDKDKKPTVVESASHPLDVNYGLLNAKLEHLKPDDEEYKIIKQYTDKTGRDYSKLEILDVWKVDRGTEGQRFKAHDDIENRRLLWHGTNVAVVTAILKTGLRIMPHSGGRVGRGIYFASENSKSAGYVGCAGNIGIMFLNEVALGKEYSLFYDNSSLKSAPSGHDSVVARGRTEPDPKFDTKIVLEGKQVTVPQGKPINNPVVSQSSFSQSEYLVYKESQVRIRYLLKLKFGSWY